MVKTYAIPNPFWYADTFVFREYNDDINTIYVKINHENKIEEIGTDISSRMHGKELEAIISDKDCKEATRLQKSILNRIGDEYWYKIQNRKKYDRKMV